MDLKITFNKQEYIATYNKDSGYFEIELKSPETGGIYICDVNIKDVLNNNVQETKVIQVLTKEKIHIDTSKIFMWIFDGYNFAVKNIVEISKYEINIDEETNANTLISVISENKANAKDIIAIKKDNVIIYWGIIDNIQNENGRNVYEYTCKYLTNMFDQTVELSNEDIIRNSGVEDFIAKAIQDNFISSSDNLLNKHFLKVVAQTHNAKEKAVDNVENKIYNLHTWMINCTQNYNITYKFMIEIDKLLIVISKEELQKELIDINCQNISDYSEILETTVISKVTVLTSTDKYNLYLLNDRTTTEDSTNINRALGDTKVIYTEKYEDAKQAALDTIKQNSYKHMASFNMANKFMQVGTPAALKTRNSIILDTYISAVKITQKKYYEYICGNMRVKFIDKILKGRK